MISQGERNVRTVKNMYAGAGEVVIESLLGANELNEKCGLFARVTLAKGCELGYHTHHGETETYYILSGAAYMTTTASSFPLMPEMCCSAATDAVMRFQTPAMKASVLLLLHQRLVVDIVFKESACKRRLLYFAVKYSSSVTVKCPQITSRRCVICLPIKNILLYVRFNCVIDAELYYFFEMSSAILELRSPRRRNLAGAWWPGRG